MTLIDDWRRVAAKAWSLRLILLAGLLDGLEFAMPAIAAKIKPLEIIEPGTLALVAAIVTAAAGIARLVAQPESMPK